MAPSCRPMADWMPICQRDFTTIIGIACFVVYVLFGIRPTIKAYRWSKRRLSRKTGDIEIMGSDSEEEFEGQDPYHSPTRLLKRFLARSANTAVPPASYFPTFTRGSPEISPPIPADRSSMLHDHLQERLRLARFQFPSHRRSCAPKAVPDLFSSSGSSTSSSQDTDSDALDNLVLNPNNALKLDLGEGTALWDEKAYAIDEERPIRPNPTVRLPNIPPPAYLDLDREMDPERFEYPSI